MKLYKLFMVWQYTIYDSIEPNEFADSSSLTEIIMLSRWCQLFHLILLLIVILRKRCSTNNVIIYYEEICTSQQFPYIF